MGKKPQHEEKNLTGFETNMETEHKALDDGDLCQSPIIEYK